MLEQMVIGTSFKISQYGTDASMKKKTHLSLPDERYQHGVLILDSLCSSTKMRSVKKLNNVKGVREKRS